MNNVMAAQSSSQALTSTYNDLSPHTSSPSIRASFAVGIRGPVLLPRVWSAARQLVQRTLSHLCGVRLGDLHPSTCPWPAEAARVCHATLCLQLDWPKTSRYSRQRKGRMRAGSERFRAGFPSGSAVLSLAIAGALGGGLGVAAGGEATSAEYRARADELQAYLDRHVLAVRFPKAVDREHGGFHVSYRRDWTPLPDQDRFVVFQARLTWTAARVAIERPERRDEYLGYVRHGVACLRDAYWDREHGGFRSYVRIAGTGEAPESG